MSHQLQCPELVAQVDAAIVDEPHMIMFKGSFKLAAEPRGAARSAALAAAEMVLVSLVAFRLI